MHSSFWICLQLIVISIINRGNTIHDRKSVEYDEFPYIVSLVRNFDDPHECGGVIITEMHVLTAAHCVIDHQTGLLFILAGAIDRRNFVEDAIMRNVERVHVHPNYISIRQSSSITFKKIFFSCSNHVEQIVSMNDIAVLKLEEPLVLGQKVNKVELPRDDELPYCQIIKYAGWGQMKDSCLPMTLQCIHMEILWPRDCQSKSMPHSEHEFCAIDPLELSRPARGDSGSPFVHQNIVYGITARGKRGPDKPFIFTKVFSYLSFIEEALKQ